MRTGRGDARGIPHLGQYIRAARQDAEMRARDSLPRCLERNLFRLTASNHGETMSENPRSTVVGRRRTIDETRQPAAVPGDVARARGRFTARGRLTVPIQETPAREAW